MTNIVDILLNHAAVLDAYAYTDHYVAWEGHDGLQYRAARNVSTGHWLIWFDHVRPTHRQVFAAATHLESVLETLRKAGEVIS